MPAASSSSSPRTSSISATRQNEVAQLAASAERVYQAMLSRIEHHPAKSPTITVSFDEYVATGVHMARLCGVATEYRSHIAAGAPTRDEIIMLSSQIMMAATGVAAAAGMVQQMVDHLTAQPIPAPASEGDICG